MTATPSSSPIELTAADVCFVWAKQPGRYIFATFRLPKTDRWSVVIRPEAVETALADLIKGSGGHHFDEVSGENASVDGLAIEGWPFEWSLEALEVAARTGQDYPWQRRHTARWDEVGCWSPAFLGFPLGTITARGRWLNRAEDPKLSVGLQLFLPSVESRDAPIPQDVQVAGPDLKDNLHG